MYTYTVAALLFATLAFVQGSPNTPNHNCCPAYLLTAKDASLEPFASFPELDGSIWKYNHTKPGVRYKVKDLEVRKQQ